MAVYEGPLGMRPPTDDEHRQKYPLLLGAYPTKPTPVILGTFWYSGFDAPRQDDQGKFWFPDAGEHWGSARGGHCYILRPPGVVDPNAWWSFFNQGSVPSCVGWGTSRAMALMNRLRYDGTILYREAQKVDDWPGEDYGGTSVRAGCDIARTVGLWRSRGGRITGPCGEDGIAANRWAANIEEIATCLSPADDGAVILNRGWVEMLNSWGTFYPHYTRIPLGALNRLVFGDGGEAAIVTDR